MFISTTSLLPDYFSADSRLWVYASPRPFTTDEVQLIETASSDFLSQWKAHGKPVQGFVGIFLNQFLVLAADETQVLVSGCSTDQSVHFMQGLSAQLDLDLFDRLYLHFWKADSVIRIPLSDLQNSLKTGSMLSTDLYINTTVQTKAEFERAGLLSLQESWLKRYL